MASPNSGPSGSGITRAHRDRIWYVESIKEGPKEHTYDARRLSVIGIGQIL